MHSCVAAALGLAAMPTVDVQSAFTYAWWLTGDDAAAERAVAAALDAAPEADTPVLLGRVRSQVERAAMGPSAEIALLHDVAGLELDQAASIAGIAPDDAPRLLASGRLESLSSPPDVEILHPERLGGLAAGARKDTIHARGCRSCGRLSELLAQGRDELVAIASVPAPEVLLGRVAAAPIEAAPSVGGVTPAAADPDAGADEPSPVPEEEPGPLPQVEPEPPRHVAPEPEGTADPGPIQEVEQEAGAEVAPHDPAPIDDETSARPRFGLLLLALGVAVLVVVVILALQPSQEPRGDALQGGVGDTEEPADPGAGEPGDATELAQPGPQETVEPGAAAPAADAFEVLATGVLIGDEDEAAPSGATLASDEPIRLAVDYAGAEQGVTLSAEWTVEGELFRAMEVLLSRARGRHLFVAPVPDGGWPTGAHHVVFSTGGDVVGSADFTVS